MSWVHNLIGSRNTEILRYRRSARKAVTRANTKQDTGMNSCEGVSDVGGTPISNTYGDKVLVKT